MENEVENVETCAIQIVQWLNPDGETGYTISRRGDANLSTQVGLLELAKMSIIETFNQEEQ